MPPDFDLTDSRIASSNSYPPLGCVDVTTPKGSVHLHDAPGAMTLMVTHQNGERAVGLMVYDPEAPPGTVQGLLTQISPCNARVTAESLLRLASEIDGGRMDS